MAFTNNIEEIFRIHGLTLTADITEGLRETIRDVYNAAHGDEPEVDIDEDGNTDDMYLDRIGYLEEQKPKRKTTPLQTTRGMAQPRRFDYDARSAWDAANRRPHPLWENSYNNVSNPWLVDDVTERAVLSSENRRLSNDIQIDPENAELYLERLGNEITEIIYSHVSRVGSTNTMYIIKNILESAKDAGKIESYRLYEDYLGDGICIVMTRAGWGRKIVLDRYMLSLIR